MLVAAARPELLDSQPSWGSGLVAQTTIPLEPLPSDDAADARGRSSSSRAGDAPIDLARLVDVAGGNPLFLEELAASVVELGDGGELPVTVREAIAARIDAMPANARGALLSAAVIGKTFWRGVLEAVGQVEDVDEALGVLEARDFVRRDSSSQLSGDPQYTFKHMLIREVAYSIVPRAARRERHAAVARYVEETIEGASETLSPILAYHWREGGEPARAIPHLLAAADAARRGWAKNAVVDLYSKALGAGRRRRAATADPAAARLCARRARRLPARGRRARRAAPRARGAGAARSPDRTRTRDALDGTRRRDARARDRGAGARRGAGR